MLDEYDKIIFYIQGNIININNEQRFKSHFKNCEVVYYTDIITDSINYNKLIRSDLAINISNNSCKIVKNRYYFNDVTVEYIIKNLLANFDRKRKIKMIL